MKNNSAETVYATPESEIDSVFIQTHKKWGKLKEAKQHKRVLIEDRDCFSRYTKVFCFVLFNTSKLGSPNTIF